MNLKDILNTNDRYAAFSGAQLTEIREGYARTEMTVEEHHLNGGNVCQGGAIFTLGDLAIAGAANSHRKLCLGINCQIHFIRSAQLGDHLVAECVELSDRKIPLLEVRITNQRNEPIALMTGECFKKDVAMEYDQL